uniref:G_PROTEIN_RECEP_F1_2 domain-containing protein n=1 Tax=Strongyloides venezuelensis TaxID=75913 RepID=A0A0K0F3M8_STRVS
MVIFFNVVDVNTINIKNHTLVGDELINPNYGNFIIVAMNLFERILLSCSAVIFFTLNYTTVIVLMRKYFIFLKNHGNVISVKTKNIACSITKALILECTVPCILYCIPLIVIGVSFITGQINEVKNIGTLTLRILIIGPFCNSLISLFVNRKNRENFKKIIISIFCCRHSMNNTVIPENRFTQRSVKATRFPVTETKFDSRFAMF